MRFVFLQARFPGDPVNEFLGYLSSGFEKDPWEYVAILVFLGVIVALILLSIFFSIRRYRKAIQAARKRLETLITNQGLDLIEQEVVRKLTRFFRRKKRYLDEIGILPAAFTAASRRMLAKKPEYDETLARLRLKLGLAAKSSGRLIHSTAELAAGMPLLLHATGIKIARGMVASIDQHGVAVKTAQIYPADSPIMMELRTRQGCFVINTRIVSAQGEAMLVKHTEKVEHLQKRGFFRKRLKLPVTVITQNGTEPEDGFIMDLSAGGARIHVPQLDLKPEQQVSLSFSPDKKKPLKLNGRVIRLIEKDSTVSVQFTDISKPAEDRIMHLVLR
ncbi:MAG: PilZ domain-containing protein [Spirochaetaceae bacterium]|nr:MAG: PilZ domain-containing protein [Spirochaetaceae bacterium]